MGNCFDTYLYFKLVSRYTKHSLLLILTQMENNVTLNVGSCSMLIPTESIETVIEEGPRICPLCGSDIRLFYINFNEKMLMCENTECEFPFGHEEVQLVRIENGEDNYDSFIGKTKQSMSPSRSSIMSTAAWSEIDKMNKVSDDLEETQLDILNFNNSRHSNKREIKSSKDTANEIEKHDKDLKGLNMDLMNVQRDIKMINNEKWIKNLMSLQGISGKSLLKPQEMIQLSKQTERQKGELKIDIDNVDEGMSSITIHLANKNNSVT